MGSPSQGVLTIWDVPANQYKASNPPWLVQLVTRVGKEPERPVEVPAVAAWLQAAAAKVGAGGPPAAFGSAARQQLFCLEDGVAYLNNGSYGAVLRPVLAAQRFYQERCEAQGVRFFEQEALPSLMQAQAALGRFVGAAPQDLVFIPNATAAMNAVLRSVHLGPGDLLLMTQPSYPAVRSAAARWAAAAGAGLADLQLMDLLALSPAPVRDGAIVARFESAFQQACGRIKLAIIDHIVSFPPVHLPVAALCALCRQHGALAAVDGAHAVGAVTLDIPSLGCDFYTSNLHKCVSPMPAPWLQPAAAAISWLDSQDSGWWGPCRGAGGCCGGVARGVGQGPLQDDG